MSSPNTMPSSSTINRADYFSSNPKGIHLHHRELVLDSNQQLRIIEWHHMDLKKFSILTFFGSFTVRCLIYPMDVIRTRLQLQQQTSIYNGMFQAMKYMIKTEGFFALYRGFLISTPQLLASYINSNVYEKSRDAMHRTGFTGSSPVISALAGGAATASDQLFSVPLDVLAQYMMIFNNHAAFCGYGKNKKSLVDIVACDNYKGKLPLGFRFIRAIYKTDGLRGFYRGLIASALLDIPRAMIFWASYYNTMTFLKDLRNFYFKRTNPNGQRICTENELLQMQAASGGLAGVIAAIWTNPLEMIRLRVQIHRTRIVETWKNMIRFEGYRMFTKGLAPRVISAGAYSFLTMLVYEMVKKVCVKPEYKYLVVW